MQSPESSIVNYIHAVMIWKAEGIGRGKGQAKGGAAPAPHEERVHTTIHEERVHTTIIL